MAVSRTWKVENFDVRRSSDGLANVIFQVQWSLTMEMTDENGQVIARSKGNGYTTLDEPDTNNFIALENLTHDQLIEWTKQALGEKVKEYEAHIYTLTANQKADSYARMVFDGNGTVIDAPAPILPPEAADMTPPADPSTEVQNAPQGIVANT